MISRKSEAVRMNDLEDEECVVTFRRFIRDIQLFCWMQKYSTTAEFSEWQNNHWLPWLTGQLNESTVQDSDQDV